MNVSSIVIYRFSKKSCRNEIKPLFVSTLIRFSSSRMVEENMSKDNFLLYSLL